MDSKRKTLGLGQCDAAIYEAEQLIQKQRLEEKEALLH